MQPLENKRRPWIALTTAVLAGVGLVLAYGSGTAAGDHPAPGPDVTNAAMGTPVALQGTLEYTVTSFACGATVSGAVPKGHFCIVRITVRNTGGTPCRPGISFARAYDAQGTEYLADAYAQIRTGSALLDDLEPGAQRSDWLIYDVPETTTLTAVLLSEPPHSAQTRITLT